MNYCLDAGVHFTPMIAFKRSEDEVVQILKEAGAKE
jgi:hypothetical protein